MNFFTIEKLQKQLAEIRQAVYREILPIPQFKFREADPPGATFPRFDDSDWVDFRVGDYWGGYDVVAWFRAWLTIPEAWRDGKVYLRFLVGPRDGGDSTAETLVYVNGEPLQGIDIWHEEAWLPPEVVQRGQVHLALRAWSGVLGVPDRRRFKLAQLALIDEPTERFFYLADTLIRAVVELAEGDLRRLHIVDSLNRAFLQLDWSRPGSPGFYQSVAEAERQLRADLERLYEVAEIKPHVVGIGHAHIDMAWLWRLGHSREKAGRTFATALHLMRQYPEYRFMHSSPQLYEYLKHDYPCLFDRVKERIQAGQWEITGGMWIEADTNLTSGESLVRQFLHGTRYIKQAFGVDSTLLWLPDVFGYSYALPQIARKSGMKYFLTSKLSWSQFNRFPYDTFNWRGLDGTELLTHFVTTPEQGSRIYTYNGQFTPNDVRGIWENYRQKDVNTELLLLYGWGDGGGGPTKEMLESARVLQNLPGLPSVGQEASEVYFARLAERVTGKPLPTWDGELYLEFHRGTYTSQAASKRANRKSELLYHDAEWASALSDILLRQADYPLAALDEGWKLILLNQFHDILPGSSIRQVYEDSLRDYVHVAALGQRALTDAYDRLATEIRSTTPSLVVLNSLSWPRDGLVSLPLSDELESKTILLDRDRPALTQVVEEGGEQRLLVEARGVPALGYRALPITLQSRSGAFHSDVMTISPTHLENRFYRLELNTHGQIVSLWDKRAAREVLVPGGRGNVFQAFVDKPMAFDAWDIDIYYQDKLTEVDDLVEVAIEETGPLRGTLRLTWRYQNSLLTQRLTLYRDNPRIDFRTTVDWSEAQTLLKVAFQVDVRSTRATYDIQFGQIERPTHWNTSWDWARFEVSAHKWADLSEGNYGVALLNDCKYGYDIRDNVMRLTLIKSAIRPDPLADKGRHEFTYSLLPHQGDWRTGGVVQAGYDLNVPLLATTVEAHPDSHLPASFGLMTVDQENVVVETVKRAEDDDAWVVRVYETMQYRSRGVRLSFGQPVRRVQECNLVEQEVQNIPFDRDGLTFDLAPYEIKTFKVWFM